MRSIARMMSCAAVLSLATQVYAGDEAAVPATPHVLITPASRWIPTDPPCCTPAAAPAPAKSGESCGTSKTSKAHSEKASCDPFKTKKVAFNPSDKMACIDRERPIIEAAPGKDIPNPPKAYLMVSGGPSCSVYIKDPDYTGPLTKMTSNYSSVGSKSAADAVK